MGRNGKKWMKGELLGVVFVLALIAMGCGAKQPSVQCNDPYKIVGSSCCLDDNANSVCDNEEEQKQSEEKVCKTDADCELDMCLGCISVEWGKANPARPECARFGLEEYECKCVSNACTEVEKMLQTKIIAGGNVRFGEEKLPITLEMQKDTRILYIADQEDEVYKLDQLQESQITVFYGKERFVIKKGTTQTIGPLIFVYTGVYPPKSGNYAIIKVSKA